MATFHVEKAYWVAHRDLIVLAGALEQPLPRAIAEIELPVEVKGPGWVPVADLQIVTVEGGVRPCVVLDYAVVEATPMMEFTDLEGRDLEIR